MTLGKRVRDDFPIFKETDEPLIFLDNASTTLKPDSVILAINEYYKKFSANVHRGIYKIGERATAEYEKARDIIASFINAPESSNIVFTGGTTESVNLVAYSWAGSMINPGDEILVTEMEHHSNLIPWQLIAKRVGAELKYIPMKEDGTLRLDDPDQYFSQKTRILAIGHQSNVLGTVNPIKKLIEIAHIYGAVTMVDGAQFVPHSSLDVQELDCDFYAFSGHKMLGPTGSGVLYGKMERFEEMKPFMGGGEMILNVSMEGATWNDVPYKFEAGTPNIAQMIGLGAAISYLQLTGMDEIDRYVSQLTEYSVSQMKSFPGVTVYGHHQNSNSTSVISFNLKNIHPHDVAQVLDMYGIAVRAGHHCAQPVMTNLGLNSTVRASFYMYNTMEEVDKFLTALIRTVEFMS